MLPKKRLFHTEGNPIDREPSYWDHNAIIVDTSRDTLEGLDMPPYAVSTGLKSASKMPHTSIQTAWN